RRPTGPG
ncbi:hypothetical protein BN1723_020733, partial [Verticillium longisporum]